MTSSMPSLLDSIFGKQNLEEISLEEIHSVINEFPSFNAAHFLLSKKLKLENDQAYLRETMKTALYFNNPVWLQSLLEEENEMPVTGDNFLIPDHASNFEKPQPAIEISEEYANEEPSIPTFIQEFNEPQPAGAIAEEYQETEPPVNYQASTFSEYQEHDEAIIESPVIHQASTPLGFALGHESVNDEFAAPEETTTVNEKYEEAQNAETINEEFAETESPINLQASTHLRFASGSEVISEEFVAPEETTTVNEKYEEPRPAETINEEFAAETTIVDEKYEEPQPAETINEEFAAPEETTTVNAHYEEARPAETINEEFAAREETIIVNEIYEEARPAETINEEFAEAESSVNHESSPPPGFAAGNEAINEENNEPGEAISINEKYEDPRPAEPIHVEFAESGSTINHQLSTIKEPHAPFDSKKAESIVLEPYHMIDYFASQGIGLTVEDHPTDQFGRQLKSFTDWLKVMKRLPAQALAEKPDDREAERIRRFAASSIEDRDILTETMAEVLAKQGMYENAIALYQKLSLIYPPKSAYFASRIEQLKASLS